MRLLLLVFTMISLYGITKIRVFHDLEAFFPNSDPDLERYEQHRQRFASDDNYIYIALVNEPSVFDSTFLQKVQQLSLAADTVVPYINNVISLTNFKDAIYTPFGAIPKTSLHYKDQTKYAADSSRIFEDERLVQRLISEDATTLSVMLFHKPGVNEEAMREMTLSVEDLVNQFDFEEAHIAGRPIATNVIIDRITSEFGIYLIVAAMLTLIVMGFLLQRWRGVLFSLTAVLIAILWFMGLMGLTGKPLDIMSPLFPALLVVVGMSDVIHLLSKYLDEVNKGNDKHTSLKIALKEIGIATFLTSFTTAIGFASLYTANVVALKSFSLYAAVGVLLTYVAVMGFAASTLLLIPVKQLANIKQHGNFWQQLMLWFYRFTKQYQAGIALVSLGVLGLCIWGISIISTNSYMLDDVPRSDRLRVDFEFFEKKLSGVRAFELAIDAQDSFKLNDLVVLNELDKLHRYLDTEHKDIGPLSSPLTFYKSMNMANNAGQIAHFVLPKKQSSIKKYEKQLQRYGKPEQLLQFVTEDKQHARLIANMSDIGSDNTKLMNQEIKVWIADNINPALIAVNLTGTALMVDKNHLYLRSSLLNGLGLAFLVVSIIMGLLFKDVRMLFISLIPNVFPLLIAGAVMGFLNISLMASTSIIFTVAFGIAVDDTIHFLSKFKLQLNKGLDFEEAIKTTFLETGKALCLTTLILFFGFFSLATSQFNTTFYIGLLVSLTLVSALIADLFLLPVCLRWVYGNKND